MQIQPGGIRGLSLRSALIALTLGLAPAACADERPVQRADLSAQLAAADLPQPQAAPVIASPYGSYLAGMVARRDGDLQAAADYMIQALRYDPDSAEVLIPALELVAATGRQEDAVDLAKRVVAQHPDNQVANLVLVIDAMRKGELKQVEEILDGLPSRGINQIMVPLLRGWLKIAEGDVDAALESISVLKGQRGFSVIHGLHAALMNEVGGRNDAAAQEYEALFGQTTRPTLRLAWLAGSFSSAAVSANGPWRSTAPFWRTIRDPTSSP